LSKRDEIVKNGKNRLMRPRKRYFGIKKNSIGMFFEKAAQRTLKQKSSSNPEKSFFVTELSIRQL
jgi:hypothetical protein